jgi:hypothetical protein
MHGFDVHIPGPVGILLPEEIPSYFSQLKKIFQPALLFFVTHI